MIAAAGGVVSVLLLYALYVRAQAEILDNQRVHRQATVLAGPLLVAFVALVVTKFVSLL